MELIALPTYYRKSRGYLKGGPRHLLMYVFGRFGIVRSVMVWRFSRKKSKAALSSGTSLATLRDASEVAFRVSQDGYCTGLTLRPEVVQEFLSFESIATCFGDGKKDFPFRYEERASARQPDGRPFRLARYTHAVRVSPALQALASDAQLLAIAREYLRSEPVLLSARMWWSLAGPADSQQLNAAGQHFHYDIDGYRGLTFFFYLTDVGLTGGPHVYVRGTHLKKSWKHLFSLFKARTDAEISNKYGPENQIFLCGPAGSGFAEDIFGFHKGMDPETGDRLIVQVRYGIQDYGTGNDD